MKVLLAIFTITLNSAFCMAQFNWQTNPVGAVFARQGGETPEGTFRFTNDGYEVYTLVCSDKSFQPASLFYGENNVDKQKVDALAPEGKVPTSMNCFVVRTVSGYIMFDTGLPASKGGKTLERLASLKISPADITAIYITHSHFDHIGGLLDEVGKAVYPNAKVYIPAAEFSFMRDTMKDASEQIASAYAGRIITLEPGDILPDNILSISAKGHTPGHTAYRLGNLLFAGDLMHGASIQLIDPTINANYDADCAQAVTTRNLLLSYAAANSLTILGAHIPGNGVIF
ncbi:MAG: MBL fold metallo-hydrolase [Muribaculaceae bacterium]|nr:MBL fold metallo-hydrolase [Muribaculaceae bacterium]